MNVEQLRLILCDVYQMDLWYPPLFGKWSDVFKKASYSQWAVDELLDYVAEHIYPRTYGSVDEFCELTHDFMMMTSKFSRINPQTHQMFQTASSMAADILDLLHAMK